MSTQRTDAEGPHLAHWLGYSAFAGWLAGPLFGAACWLARGGGADASGLALGPDSGYLPLAGLLLMWAIYTAMTRSALAVGWGRAAYWSTAVLAAGCAGWLLVQFLHLPAGGSIDTLALAWIALTAPYPAVAGCAFRRAVRPAEPGDVDVLHRGAAWLTAHRPRAIAVGCLAATALGFALESVDGSGAAQAAAIPVRSAYAEPAAPDPMLLLVRAPRGYSAHAYGYEGGMVTIGYLGADAPSALYDDLEVIVAPRTAASPCGVDWAGADAEIDQAAGVAPLSCTAAAAGHWLAEDSAGDTLYIGAYRDYYVALAVSTGAAMPLDPSTLPALFKTLRPADTDQRALLNAEEDTAGTA